MRLWNKYKITFNQSLLSLIFGFFLLSFGLQLYIIVNEYVEQSTSDIITRFFFLAILLIILINIYSCFKNNYVLNYFQVIIFIIIKLIIFFYPYPLYRSNLGDPVNILLLIETIGIFLFSLIYYLFFHTNMNVNVQAFLLKKKINIYKNKKVITESKKAFSFPNKSLIINLDKKINISNDNQINICAPINLKEKDLDNIRKLDYVFGIKDSKIICAYKLNPKLKYLKITKLNFEDIIKAYNLKNISLDQCNGKYFLNINSRNIIHSILFSPLYENKYIIKDGNYKIHYE